MECPHCNYDGSSVTDTRDNPEYTRRRRRCNHCHTLFTTREVVVSTKTINPSMADMRHAMSQIQSILLSLGTRPND